MLLEIENFLNQSPETGEHLIGEFNGLYKMGIGEYRVIYAKIDDAILILRIRHRSKVYE